MITTRLPWAVMNSSSAIASLAAPVLQREVLHREVDAGELAPGHGQVAGRICAARQHDRVEIGLQIPHRYRRADGSVGLEDHAVLLHQPQASVEEFLLHL